MNEGVLVLALFLSLSLGVALGFAISNLLTLRYLILLRQAIQDSLSYIPGVPYE